MIAVVVNMRVEVVEVGKFVNTGRGGSRTWLTGKIKHFPVGAYFADYLEIGDAEKSMRCTSLQQRKQSLAMQIPCFLSLPEVCSLHIPSYSPPFASAPISSNPITSSVKE
jgi:hypothetical protein